MRTHIDTAREGENAAAAYLERAGYRILERNFRFHHGEIDLIALDGDCTVFVEVKSRISARYGSPLEAVPPYKQRQIVRVARGYLYMHRIAELTCRFDVIAIEWAGGAPVITHIQNAFPAE